MTTETSPNVTLDCIEIAPQGPVSGSIIWLHGLGASGHDFTPVVPHLGLPNVRFVFPHAPNLPVTINGGLVMPAWYDLRSIGPSPDRESEGDIRDSAVLIQELIDREVTRGVSPNRIVLAGFSQGAGMALHCGLRQEQPLAGLMILSGYLVLAEKAPEEWAESSRSTPVYFSHGTRDGVVRHQRGRDAFDVLKSHGYEVSWSDYPMMHEVCAEQVRDISEWLQGLFSSQPNERANS